jgi:hypothetical protein
VIRPVLHGPLPAAMDTQVSVPSKANPSICVGPIQFVQENRPRLPMVRGNRLSR